MPWEKMMPDKDMKQKEGKTEKESPEQLESEELEGVEGGALRVATSSTSRRTRVSNQVSDKLGLDEAYYGRAELDIPLKR